MKYQIKVIRNLFTCAIVFFMVLIILPAIEDPQAGGLSGTIKIGGTGSAIGAMKELAAVFRRKHPGVNISFVPHLGTRGGIKAVTEGAIDIGLSGRPLNPDEKAQGLKGINYAHTPFMFVTNREIKGANFTMDYLTKIYAGEIRAWPDGSAIRLILRPEGDVDTLILNSMSSEMTEAVKKAHSREGMKTALTDQDSADAVEKIPGAIGTSSLSQMITEKRSYYPLTVNGTVPSVENASSGRYPYYKDFHMITGPKTTPLTKRFIEFVTSSDGKEILIRTGNFFPESDVWKRS